MSFKKCKVVMLSTNEKATIFKILNIDKLCIGANEIPTYKDRHQNQHLYIISDDEIKEGDWVLTPNNEIKKFGEIGTYLSRDKKIIATTSSLTKEMYSISFGKYQEPLPQPSKSFIEKYVEEYNKGNIITDVLVEYVDNGHEDWCERTDQPIWIEKLVPCINHKNNTITIKRIKNSWNRNEVIVLLGKAQADGIIKPTLSSDLFDKWIEENL